MSQVAMRGRGIRPLDLVFWLGVAAVAAANVVVLVQAFTTVRLWEDEAFNLTVPLNLLRGHGYTSDGTLSGSELTPFDVRISTGPVMLLPIAAVIGVGVDPVIAGRLVAALGYALLLGSLWMLGRRLGGRWTALIAAALPLAYAADRPPSPIQTPFDILGEVTAAGLLAAAMVVLHRRPWLAGLFLGLAVQTKFVALLAIPAFALAALLDAPGPGLGQRLRVTVPRVLAAAGFAALPTLLFEVGKLAALGPGGYVENLRNFAWFLLSGGQSDQRVPPLEKLSAFLSAWHLPWWSVLVVVVVGSALAVAGAMTVAREPGALRAAGARSDRREFVVVAVAAGTGLITYLAWWLASSHTPLWLRHPAPGALAFVPVVVGATIVLARVTLRDLAARHTPAVRIVSAAVGVLGIAMLAISLVGRITTFPEDQWESLGGQREAAREIAKLGQDRLASEWGAPVSVIVMSGAHSALVDAGRVVIDDHQVWLGVAPPNCEVVLQTGPYLVCPPPGLPLGNGAAQ